MLSFQRPVTPPRRSRPAPSPSALAGAAGRAAILAPALEALEPRMLLTAFVQQPLPEYFNVPGTIHEIAPPAGEIEGFGALGARLGDIDGDGRDDFAVSAPGDAAAGVSGAVFLYSGRTGELIRELRDGAPGFGAAMAGVGDVNGDGVPDLLVGSPLAVAEGDPVGAMRGAAYVFSGLDGSVIRMFVGEAAGDELGFAVASVADLDGDGVGDLLVGAPGSEGGGRVFAYSGATGGVIHLFSGQSEGDRFGASLSTTTLGEHRIIVGAPVADGDQPDSGRVYVYSGETGELRFALNGRFTGDQFGAAVLGLSGLDGRILVGAPTYASRPQSGQPDTFPPILDIGALYTFRGDGLRLETDAIAFAGGRYGTTITNVGDINGDGLDDYAVTRGGDSDGFPLVVHSFRGGRLYPAQQFSATVGEQAQLGDAVFPAGDVDGDGEADVITLAPDGSLRIISSLGIVAPHLISGGSEDLSIVYNNEFQPIPLVVRRQFAFIDGVYRRYTDIPGLGANAVILGVNNAGLIVGADVLFVDGGPTFGSPFFIIDGVRVPLQDAVVEVVGGVTPNYTTMGGLVGVDPLIRPVVVGADGAVLFTDTGPGGGPRAWLYRDGVLAFLWNGVPLDINDAGAILGSEDRGADTSVLVLRAPGGAVTDVAGLVPFRLAPFGASRITAALSNNNEVVGQGHDGNLVLWRDGVVTVLAGSPNSGIYPEAWEVRDVDDSGRVLVVYRYLTPGGTRTAPSTVSLDYLYVPGEGLLRVSDHLWGTGEAPRLGRLLRLTEEGSVLATNSVLQLVPDIEVWTLAPNSPVSATAQGTLGVNIFGDVIWLERTADGWTGFRVPPAFDSPRGNDIRGVFAFTHPSGTPYFFIVGGNRIELSTPFQSNTRGGGPIATPLLTNATVFTASGNRTVLADTNSAGDLIIYYQQTPPDHPLSVNSFQFDNLTQTHLRPQGIELPPVASGLTAFGTSWGSNHIFFLGADGNLYGVWIPPGGTQWLAVNLSALAGVDPIADPASFTLTSFTTAWDTLHVNLADPSGRVTSVWWDSSFGPSWTRTVLVDDPAIRLDHTSIAAFTTPWGALNFVGRDAETGELAAYWWTPETQEWRLERIEVAETGQPTPALTGAVAAAVRDGAELSLYARDAESGEFLRLHWTLGEGAAWNLENLSRAVL